MKILITAVTLTMLVTPAIANDAAEYLGRHLGIVSVANALCLDNEPVSGDNAGMKLMSISKSTDHMLRHMTNGQRYAYALRKKLSAAGFCEQALISAKIIEKY